MANHTPLEHVCPLCRLAINQPSQNLSPGHSEIISQLDQVFAIITKHQWPNNYSNGIGFPNDHYKNLADLPLSSAAPIHKAAQDIALAMKKTWQRDGISLRQQHYEPAGCQDVRHDHLHITPRCKNDHLGTLCSTSASIMPEDERVKLAAQLRKAPHVLSPQPKGYPYAAN